MSENPLRCEIFWANLEPVVGSEQGKSRPVLIISNNLMNETAPVVIVIPMTTSDEKVKSGPFNIPYKSPQISVNNSAVEELKKLGHYYNPQADGVLLCNQGRTISKSRLIHKVGSFNDITVIRSVEEAVKHSYALEACEVCGIPLRTNGLFCIRCKRQYRKLCVCGKIVKIEYNFCPKCGRRIQVESSKQTGLN